MSTLALELGPTLLVWLAVIYKLPTILRHPRDPVVRAYLLNLSLFAVALTLRLPAVYRGVDELAGIPNLAGLLGQSLGLAAGSALQAFFLQLGERGRAQRDIRMRWWLLTVTVALMTVLFVLAGVEEGIRESGGSMPTHPGLVPYWAVFGAYVIWIVIDLTRLSWRYARQARRVMLGLGLRLMAAGGATGVVWIAHKVLHLGVRALSLPYPFGGVDMVNRVLFAVMVGLVVMGSTLPAWGPRVGVPALWSWCARYRAHQRLYPLWRALYEAQPEIALAPPRSPLAERLSLRDLRFRLYRRVIEIRDGRLALLPYLDPEVASRACRLGREAGLTEDEVRSIAEAASLSAALKTKAAGKPPVAALAPPVAPGGADLETEIAALAQLPVWRAGRRSRAARLTLEQLDREASAASRS